MTLPAAFRYVIAWLGFVAMGYGLTLMFLDRDERPAADVITDTPTDTPAAPEPDGAANIGEINIELAGLDGKNRTLSEWSGKPVVVNFWATWCGPCRREIPLLKALQDEYADQDLTIVGVAIDEMGDVIAYNVGAEFNYPILVGEEDGFRTASAMGVNNFVVPVTAFVDRTGQVTRIHTGEIFREDAEFAIAEIVAR
ncbi:MAG: TlpA disulfide reductase family protein [Pseudomonadota bacterium]